MKYEKAEAVIIEFEDEDIVAGSGEDCEQPSWDANYCNGVTQAVTKAF